MKKTFILIVLGFCVFLTNAQDDEIQTLFGDRPFRISGFGGPFMTFSTLDGEFAHMMGGGGGVLLGDFFFGGYGLGLTNNIPYAGTDDEISFGHGGLWLGYNYMSKKLVHPSFHVQVGWGEIRQRERYGGYTDDGDNIMVITPTLEVEMNITRYFRLGLGGTYRSVMFVDAEGYSEKDFSGPEVLLSFKFGWF